MKDGQRNAGRMTALVERWRESGQTLSAFARAQGVTRDKLVYWRHRLRVAPRVGKRRWAREEITFTPVEVMAGSVGCPAVEVTLPGGVRLAFGSGATPELVAAVIEGLRRGC
jgi:hypothetical protein